MITIHVVTYNEEIVLPFFIKHYRERFPNCNIIIYDNYSNDNTENIAIINHCNIIKYNTNNQLSDFKLLEIKNNCWKNADTDWVLICDCDEFLDINYKQLLYEEDIQSNIIKPNGWSMIGFDQNSYNLDLMTYGIRDKNYDKCILFNKKYIKEINYKAGCHACNPISINKIKYNTIKYNLFHFHHINENYRIKKHKLMVERMSELNKKYSMGIHYYTSEQEIRDNFQSMRKNAIQIRNSNENI